MKAIKHFELTLSDEILQDSRLTKFIGNVIWRHFARVAACAINGQGANYAAAAFAVAAAAVAAATFAVAAAAAALRAN